MAFLSLSSLCATHQCFIVAVVVACILFCLPMTTTALSMKDVVGQAMMRAKMEQQQQQEDHHRQKRAVTKTDCAQPDNLDAMFKEINSQLSSVEFMKNLYNKKAISIPASEVPVETETGSANKTCPSSLTTDSSLSVADRSLCPYYFNVLRLPEGYYPSSLNTVRCKCQRCVQHTAYGCEAVSTPIAVLKPVGCFQGMQKYQEEIIHVNTACTCASGGSVQTTTPSTTTTTEYWGVE
ncbi:hypothetical protein ACOMHN_033207 [Nucella lapillus]